MEFRIVHTTQYRYSAPAIESFSELRVRPRQTLRQVVHKHATEVHPRVPLEVFQDYYGNWVESLSVPFRHSQLVVTSRSLVQTRPYQDAMRGLDLTVSEAAHLCWPQRRELYDFLVPSMHVPLGGEIDAIAREHLPRNAPFAESILKLNNFFFKTLKYEPGTTDISTPILEVWEKKRGVCQDFAHLMIAVLRSTGLPARYVSGYIETERQAKIATGQLVPDPEEIEDDEGEDPEHPKPLIGATASHAWVEIYMPNGHWVGIDPTNNQMEGERHVQIGIGRDYADVPPLRGAFKGAEEQQLKVKVSVARQVGEENGGANDGPVLEEI
jgi:transglutaminase-like putative cysteine protease